MITMDKHVSDMTIMACRELTASHVIQEFKRTLDEAGVEAWRAAKTPEAREQAWAADKAFRTLFQLITTFAETPTSQERSRNAPF
jgi:hypothetical protein